MPGVFYRRDIDGLRAVAVIPSWHITSACRDLAAVLSASTCFSSSPASLSRRCCRPSCVRAARSICLHSMLGVAGACCRHSSLSSLQLLRSRRLVLLPIDDEQVIWQGPREQQLSIYSNLYFARALADILIALPSCFRFCTPGLWPSRSSSISSGHSFSLPAHSLQPAVNGH